MTRAPAARRWPWASGFPPHAESRLFPCARSSADRERERQRSTTTKKRCIGLALIEAHGGGSPAGLFCRGGCVVGSLGWWVWIFGGPLPSFPFDVRGADESDEAQFKTLPGVTGHTVWTSCTVVAHNFVGRAAAKRLPWRLPAVHLVSLELGLSHIRCPRHCLGIAPLARRRSQSRSRS